MGGENRKEEEEKVTGKGKSEGGGRGGDGWGKIQNLQIILGHSVPLSAGTTIKDIFLGLLPVRFDLLAIPPSERRLISYMLSVPLLIPSVLTTSIPAMKSSPYPG